MQHIKSLDGIRGVAVSLVVLFHFGWFLPGWVGVQLFFVLSGYLITSILVREKNRPFAEYMGRFYWRRSLRIFPLYFAFLAAVAAVYAFAEEPASFGRDWLWLATYTANFARLRDTDLGPYFVHLWSLAVEEQFYLIWPLVVFFTPDALFRRVVIAILILAPLSRLAFYLCFRDADPDWLGRSIYGLPTSQFDAFAAGAAIAIFKIERPMRWFIASAALAAICGAAVIAHQHLAYSAAIKWSFGYAMFLMQDGEFVWGYSLINLVAASGTALALSRRIPSLEWSPLARVGLISYGVYVYHLPILILFGPYPNFLMYALTVYLVSELSFRFLEIPFLKLKEATGSIAELLKGIVGFERRRIEITRKH